LVSRDGYPLAYEVFEGSKFEGHTIIPVIESFKKKYHIDKLVIIADAGMLSNKNMVELLNKGYEFILGGRIKNETDEIKRKIFLHQFTDGQSMVIARDEQTRLIVGFSLARAKKDARNRQQGLKKLEKSIQTGKLNKRHINKRGYNKYLKIEGEVKIAIDYEKFDADRCWDGLKGYITNSKLSKEQVMSNYKHLWQIEKAFRISKTDLRVRPIYHRLPKRISAHLSLAFCAYKLYKELERHLKAKKSPLTALQVIERMKTIYRLQFSLPESLRETTLLFAKDSDQIELLHLFNLSVNLN
jgi:transposase